MAASKLYKTLNLSHNNIGSEGARALINYLRECTTLKQHDLANNNIDTSGIEVLAEVLSSCIHLRKLIAVICALLVLMNII